jgi:hypothetical protein
VTRHRLVGGPPTCVRVSCHVVSCCAVQVARLETAVVEGIFDVLIRIARHSPAAAHLVAECPRLWPCVRLLFIEVFPDKLSQACLPPPPQATAPPLHLHSPWTLF